MNYRPVFIGGLRRSGTTLMRGALGRHPDLGIFLNDLPFFEVVYEKYKFLNMNSSFICSKMVDDILNHYRMEEVEVKFDRNGILKNLGSYPSINPVIIIEEILKSYASAVGKPRWGLKNPVLEFYADVLFEQYPNAIMVHMIRDPRDRLASIKAINWEYTLEGNIDEWSKSVALAKENSIKYEGSYFVVRYESFLVNPQQYLKKIMEAAELPLSEEVLDMESVMGERSSHDNSGEPIRKGIYKSSIGKYIFHLPAFEVYVQQQVLGEEMIKWGYELLPLSLPTSFNEGGSKVPEWRDEISHTGIANPEEQLMGLN
ncbi:hypothetical protein CEE37_02735 [candidate division LCP-89 bacterium B3_LCP]|uniref:Sulfotransferase family protein n=1 Tax=candidate division LCP-89 bacterium B3_LCP TaxID=2012998 RepID=A0A532V2R4_UNCL8|nr:MAG: hypothetical protein CEE37_02735 [candidate division LCP-89 bacterium B3_LCP]